MKRRTYTPRIRDNISEHGQKHPVKKEEKRRKEKEKRKKKKKKKKSGEHESRDVHLHLQ